jgi:hypothetical protein
VAGGTHLIFLPPRDAQGALDIQPFHILAVVIGADGDLMPHLLEDQSLLQDANMAPIVGEKGSGSKEKNPIPPHPRFAFRF